MMGEQSIKIELNGDQAIVLFDWLARLNEAGGHGFEDSAEQRVLWDLEADLESKLVAPLMSDYKMRLASARARIRDRP